MKSTNKISKKKIIKDLAFFALSAIILFQILNICFPLNTSLSYSQLISDRNDKILYSFLSEDDKWRMYAEWNEIPEQLKEAIIYKEDKYFYYHFGVNPLAITRALFNNIIKNKRTSGASTISMQVVRLLEPKQRTYGNKIIEMFKAFQLEWTLSKNEILQLYLNLLPYGGNIEGVKSAAILYFNKNVNHLSLSEITALCIIPNRPSSLKIGENNALVEEERNKWLNKFQKDKLFPSEDIEDALAESFEAKRQDSPKFAPHFSFRMRYQEQDKINIKTTLDYEFQKRTEKALSDYMLTIQAYNIHNAAILVIDNESREVLSYVGSANFYGTEDAGQVDGIRAVRQPGSTLKPLVYGLAFDAGLLTPKTVITDLPINYNGYSPVNFNQEYNGYVSIEQALAQSLNIPAVKALELLGVEKVIDKLIACDFNGIKKQKDILGLSLVLGGCGVSLEELSSLFASFANEGNYQRIKYLRNDQDSSKTEILSSKSCFMLSEILTQLERPDLPSAWQSASNLPEIAWKTGTSYGRKDAWSIGYNDKYTIGVWLGNFSGEGVPELTGGSMATPLLFNIFKTIDKEPSKAWLKAPSDLDFRFVCPNSGLPPSKLCEHQVLDYFIPSVSSNITCTHIQKYYISENDSFSYCMNCLPEAGYKIKHLEYHPVEILAFYERSNINYLAIPKHNPNCEKWDNFDPPKIATPSNGHNYYMVKDEMEALVFTCQTASDVSKVVWYVNEQVYKIAEKNESVLFYPDIEGKFKISCSDDQGRNSNIEITIDFI